jgi:hypothetical protein
MLPLPLETVVVTVFLCASVVNEAVLDAVYSPRNCSCDCVCSCVLQL